MDSINVDDDASVSSVVENEYVKTVKSSKLFPIFSKSFKPRKPDPLQSIQITIQKTNPPKKKKSLLGTKETEGLNQLVLDAGQKVMGPRFCSECGMLYSPGDFQDEEMHRKAHSRLNNMFTLTLWKSVKILQQNVDGSFIIAVNCNEEPKRVLNKLNDFLSWMDSELGVGSGSDQPHEKMFLCLFPTKRKNVVRILGCAIMESLRVRQIMAFALDSKEPENECVHPSKLLIGLTRLWTDKSFRKKQIATKLCEAIRLHSGIPGFVLAKSKFGILEPSEEGRAFFLKYTEGQGAHYTYTAEIM